MFDFIPVEIFDALKIALRYVVVFAPLWLPVVFIFMVFDAWLDYRRGSYWRGMGKVLLEIKLPKEITKSPLAMEVVLGSMHQTADEGNWYWKYWKGQTRSWFSLEVVSFGGDIHFYIWARKKYKNSIEANIYAQYPGVEIYEVEDYTKNIYYDPLKHKMFANQWELLEPDPYPIKTYVDYGLDKDPKEELKVDPMTSFMEFLGSITGGHTMMYQMIIRAHKKDKTTFLPWNKKVEKLAWSEEVDSWKESAKEEIQKIIDGLKTDKESGFPRIPTKGEAEKIAALERSVSKIAFDVSIRSIYIADKDKYSGSYLGGILGSFKQYGYPGLNAFKISGLSSSFDYPWSKWWFNKEKLNYIAFDEYKMRRFFFSPHMGKFYYSKPFILNAEELATIYHFPGQVVATPTFERVPSKKSNAPSNLPI